MMPYFSEEHALFQVNDTFLRSMLSYIEFVSIPETNYVTGRPPISRKSLLKCFLLQTHFRIPSLRKLTQFLKDYPYWCWVTGLSQVPHLSTFSRAATWWRAEGFSMLHNKILQDLAVKDPKLVLIDSTALRSSLYDLQAEWGRSTRYQWYKGYKLHLATTPDGLILAYDFTTANVYDSEAFPTLLKQLTNFKIGFFVGDAAYDSKKVREASKDTNTLFISPINPRKGGKRKDAFGRVMPTFLKTTFGRMLFSCRSRIEHVFCCLKNKLGLEQPRWYEKNRYMFHCQICILIHNIGKLF